MVLEEPGIGRRSFRLARRAYGNRAAGFVLLVVVVLDLPSYFEDDNDDEDENKRAGSLSGHALQSLRPSKPELALQRVRQREHEK